MIFISCSSQRRIANYKITPNGAVVYKYTKVGEPRKDILSTGDTLYSTGDTLYFIHPKIN